MKLHSNKRKKVIIALAILAGVLVVALIAGMIFIRSIFKPMNEYGISHITFYSLPDKTTYFVGEKFDPTGLQVQVVTYGKAENYFVDHTAVTYSGFDSSVVNDEVAITVSYKGVTTKFNIKVIDRPTQPPVVTDMELVGFKDTYTLSFWNEFVPQVSGASIKLIYSDESTKDGIWLQSEWITGYKKLSAPGNIDLTINYDDNGTLFQKTVTITITN